LKEQADLSKADNLRTKNEKGEYVYEQLRTVALKTQGELVAYLKTQNVTFHQYYITNMISVMGATSEIIKAISARSEVSKIVGNPAIRQEVLPVQLETLDSLHPNVEDGITSTGAPRVWNELHVTGQGIVVAGQDTGVQWDHPALKTHYRGYSANGVDHNIIGMIRFTQPSCQEQQTNADMIPKPHAMTINTALIQWEPWSATMGEVIKSEWPRRLSGWLATIWTPELDARILISNVLNFSWRLILPVEIQ